MQSRIAGYSYNEWKKLQDEYINDFKTSKRIIRPFRAMIEDILKNETDEDFRGKTQLSENMLYRLRNQIDENNPPKMQTLISVCVGYNLDIILAQDLLKSLGLGFNPHKKRDYAYTFLLTRCRGKNIFECNEILKELGIKESDYLGSRPRNAKK